MSLPIATWRADAAAANARVAAAARGAQPNTRAAAPGAARAGRVARAAGEAAEDAVERACAAYQRAGRAVVWKLNAPVRVLGKVTEGRFKACWAGKAPVDYAGTLAGGRAVAFEVKGTAATALSLEGRDGDRLGAAQVQRLAQLDAAGAVVGVLVRIATSATLRKPGPARRWFWLPWRGWLDACAAAEALGRKSLSAGMLETHGRECPVNGGWPDWLAAMGEV